MPKIEFHIHPDLVGQVPEIKPANKCIPDWYKKMPLDKKYLPKQAPHPYNTKYVDVPMIKRCLPVRDYLTSGYIIPFWRDAKLKKDAVGKYEEVLTYIPEIECEYNVQFEWHGIEQVKGSPIEKLTDGEKVIKLACPWTIVTPKGYSTLFFSPFYFENSVTILPSIVDTDQYATPTNFPSIIMGDEVTIEMGDPIIQAIPFKRESWTSKIVTKNHIENTKKQKIYPLLSRIKGKYTKELWQRKYFR